MTVTSAALAAGGMLAATGFAALDVNWVAAASPTSPVAQRPNSEHVVASAETLPRPATDQAVPAGWQRLGDNNRERIAVAGQPLKVPNSGPAAVPAGAATAKAPIVKEVDTAHPANAPAPASVATAAPARTPTTAAASAVAPAEVPIKLSAAARAVSAALTQQGTPYVYGGNAPGGFDCSGLVQWVYNKVGIALPRTAAAQATAGHRVSLSHLQPGDLLFFYQPVGHVVIYVGNGKIVEASQPGQPVHVRSLYLGGFVEARRIV
ncbi:MAG TPA: C40 family peptidase [Pseudonocardiaceae bacterium]